MVTVRLPYGACMGPYGACESLKTPVECYDHRMWPVRAPVMAVSAHTGYWPRMTAYVPSTGCLLRACTTFRHGLLTGIQGLYGLKKSVELRAGSCGPARYAVRSPTGHWNFGPYGARKLPGSSM